MENQTLKESLLNFIQELIDEGTQGLEMCLQLEGMPSVEVILNPNDNLKYKAEYINNTYDDNLKHKHAPVKIVSFYDWEGWGGEL